jgi:hypothetical protein
MRVTDPIKKCVAFIGQRKADDGDFVLRGSVLFFGDETATPKKYAYIITARHVIDGIRKCGSTEAWIRVNTKSGGFDWVRTNLSDWKSPEDRSVDVAMHFGWLSEGADQMFLQQQLVLTPTIERDLNLNVGIGDHIFIAGLFSGYAGKNRNVPILRFGNLAAYPEERIKVRGFGQMDAYLIEARSDSGLSGAPVFYHAYASPSSALRPFARHQPQSESCFARR